MSDTMLNALDDLFWFLSKPQQCGGIISPLSLGEMKHREVNPLLRGGTSSEWWSSTQAASPQSLCALTLNMTYCHIHETERAERPAEGRAVTAHLDRFVRVAKLYTVTLRNQTLMKDPVGSFNFPCGLQTTVHPVNSLWKEHSTQENFREWVSLDGHLLGPFPSLNFTSYPQLKRVAVRSLTGRSHPIAICFRWPPVRQ